MGQVVASAVVVAVAALAAVASSVRGDEVRSDDPNPGAELVGVWESVSRSKGGIGMTLEFKADGSAVHSPGAMVDFHYHLEGDRVVVEQPDAELPLVFRYRDGVLSMVAPPQASELPDSPMERIGTSAPGDPGFVGRWRSGPPAQPVSPQLEEMEQAAAAMDESFFVFTRDGRMLLRVPFVNETGRYSVAGGRVTLEFSGGTNSVPYRIEGDTLILGETTAENRYRRADY